MTICVNLLLHPNHDLNLTPVFVNFGKSCDIFTKNILECAPITVYFQELTRQTWQPPNCLNQLANLVLINKISEYEPDFYYKMLYNHVRFVANPTNLEAFLDRILVSKSFEPFKNIFLKTAKKSNGKDLGKMVLPKGKLKQVRKLEDGVEQYQLAEQTEYRYAFIRDRCRYICSRDLGYYGFMFGKSDFNELSIYPR